MLRITIDGNAHDFPEDTLLLRALHDTGHDVPHLCHDDRLQPHGGCRLCMVEVDGCSRPVASCSAHVTDGMVIHTDTSALRNLRKTNLSLLAAHYPASAVAWCSMCHHQQRSRIGKSWPCHLPRSYRSTPQRWFW